MSSFALTTQPCRYCGGWHNGMCPRVAEVEYYPDGSLKRVKLRDPAALSGSVATAEEKT